MPEKQNQYAFVVGDSYTATSGLSNVARNLRRILQAMGYRVIYVSISNTPHGPVAKEAYYIGNHPDSAGANPVQKFDQLIAEFKPNIVVSCHDLWMLCTPMLSSLRSSFCWVQYNPIEANYYPRQVIYSRPDRAQHEVAALNIADIANNADYIIAYNSFGAQGLNSMGVNVNEEIHNGYDPQRTSLIDDKSVLSRRRKELLVADDCLLFMSMGKNISRKRHDILLEAWCKFQLKLKNTNIKARLHIHTERVSANGFDIASICKRLGISDSVSLPNSLGYSDQDINLLYNVIDAYVAFPGGEGHGYGFLESMVLAKPLIYGDYGGHISYCEGAGIAVPVKQYVSSQNIDAPRAIINTDLAAQAMYDLAIDKQRREDYGKRGVELSKTLCWQQLDIKFKSAFTAALAKKAHRVESKREASAVLPQ